MLYIPDNCTSALQVNDIAVSGNVKTKCRQLYADNEQSELLYNEIIAATAKFLPVVDTDRSMNFSITS